MIDYLEWLSRKRREAVARGGKPLKNLPGAVAYAEFPFVANRVKGEMVNPLTGEIATGCLTVARMSEELAITPQKVGDEMVALGWSVMVLRAFEVPMLCAPHLTKPRYYHSPEATSYGVWEGFVIPVRFEHGGRETTCMFITPDGQEKLKASLMTRSARAGRMKSKAVTRRQAVGQLLAKGLSQAEISRQTNLPKQTVSRMVKALTAAD